MRDQFRSYYRPTDLEFSKMWNDGIFSFDTNVLLDIYRYTPETRNKLFEIFRQFNDRIWIPHQVAYEYHERRLDVITDQVKIAETIEDHLSKSLEQIKQDLRGYKNHPFANIDQLMGIIEDAIIRAKASLQAAKSEHPNFIRSDQLLETITELFSGGDKIGRPYTEEELAKLYEDFDKRYEKKIPPGFEDAKKKKDERKYGDAIIWYQLIDRIQNEKKPLIFVTGERKEDWWLRHKGEIISPRRELIREMNTKANELFYMYSTDQFMERAENFFGLREQKGAIEEVREIIRQDEAKEDEDVLRQWQKAFNELSIYASSRTPEHNRKVAEILLEGHTAEEAAIEAGISPAMAGYLTRIFQSYLREKLKAGLSRQED